MDKEIAIKWVAALRSGEYKQAQGALCQYDHRGDRGFCCLGVLTDMYHKHTACGAWKDIGSSDRVEFVSLAMTPHGRITVQGDSGTPPTPVVDWAGMKDHNPTIPTDEQATSGESATSLAELNDGGWSFARIADYIEQHYARL